MSVKPRIRIEADGVIGSTCRVVYLDKDEDGNERAIDISSCVQGVDTRIQVGEVTTATLRVILVEGHTDAEVESVIMTKLRRRRRGRLHRITAAWRW